MHNTGLYAEIARPLRRLISCSVSIRLPTSLHFFPFLVSTSGDMEFFGFSYICVKISLFNIYRNVMFAVFMFLTCISDIANIISILLVNVQAVIYKVTVVVIL